MQEEWKEVIDYPRYKVSNKGRVWDSKNDREVSQVLTGDPQYYYVNMSLSKGKRKLVRLHRVVARAFCEGWSEDFNIVDHIDRNKFNNHASNLRWTNPAGNQRNLANSVLMGDIHLRDFVKMYDKPSVAYGRLHCYLASGLTEKESLEKYDILLKYGTNQKRVIWNNQEVYLMDLCTDYKKDYRTVLNNLNQGWDVWNSLFSVKPQHLFSMEIVGRITSFWFPSREYLLKDTGLCDNRLREMLTSGAIYEDMIEYDSLDYKRQTILGVTGTIKELCKHFGKTESMVFTRMDVRGMSLEEALTKEPERVKKVKIDGVSRSPKSWYDYFGLEYKTVKNYRDTNKPSFEETLIRFGINTSDMKIEYGD